MRKNYSSFLFLKIDSRYRDLISNERIAANDALERAVAKYQDELFLRTYWVTGLKHDCDIMLWLMADDVDLIQKAWGAISKSLGGKYLALSRSLFGLCEMDSKPLNDSDYAFGKKKYMLIHPVSKNAQWHELSPQEKEKHFAERAKVLSGYPQVSEHIFYSYGLDDQDFIVIREAEKVEDLALASKELRQIVSKSFTKIDTPCVLSVGRDLRLILSNI